MNSHAFSTDDIWKERLGLTTGSFVVWGLLLLQLWPIVKHIQLGPFTLLASSGGNTPEYAAFGHLVVLVTLGGWVLLLAALHVLCRGLLLIGEAKNIDDHTHPVRRILKSVAHDSYVGVFLLSGLIIGWVLLGALLSLVYFYLKLVLVGWLHLYELVFNIIFGLSITILFLFGIGVVGDFLENKYPALWNGLKTAFIGQNKAHRVARYALCALFFGSIAVVQLAASTIELHLNKKIFYQSQDKTVELYVELGGSTSAAEKAEVEVFDSQHTSVEQLKLTEMDLGEGRYLGYVELARLKPGLYQAELTYKHPALNFSPPFIHLQTQRIEKFLIARESGTPGR